MPNTLGKTEICNIALRRIGVRPISNVDSDTANAAVALRAMWNLSVQSVLRLNDWNFATKITALALLSSETVIGWDYLYTYPADCIMAWSVCTAASVKDSAVTIYWESLLSPDTNTLVIATNQDTAYLRYTAMVNDPTKWDSDFVNALAWKLAYEVSPELTTDATTAQRCLSMHQLAIAEAQTMNHAENNNPTTPEGPYVEVR